MLIIIFIQNVYLNRHSYEFSSKLKNHINVDINVFISLNDNIYLNVEFDCSFEISNIYA